MDHRIKELINLTKEKFGLENYYLQTHELHRKTNTFNETVYTLSMEWFPNHITEFEEDLNPDGTASIEIDIHSRRFESVIFVNEISYATKRMMNHPSKDLIIAWLEGETGLTYGKHLILTREADGEFYFRECVDGIPTSPGASIELKINKDGMLLFFSIYGKFSPNHLIKKEAYTLELEDIASVIKNQLKLIEFPLEQQKKWHPVYAIEEIYISNMDRFTIPFEVFSEMQSSFIKIGKVMHWQTPINIPFKRQPINFYTDVSVEQAFSCERDPNTYPITDGEQEKSIHAIESLLRQVYPNDSGNWRLHTLHREFGYIHGILRRTECDNRLFQPKITVMIDTESFQVINYIDNLFLLETFQEFQQATESIISKDNAYETLKPYFELTPSYVYDVDQEKYILCGKLDCHHGVDAVTGEVVLLDDL